jgi:hypothetical protein
MITEVYNITRNMPTNMTNLYLYLAIATAIGVIITAAGVFIGPRLVEKNRRRHEHFERLRSEIFWPWLSELEKPHEFEFNIKVDDFRVETVYTFDLDLEKKYLFKDVAKHSSDIIKDWETFKKELSEYGEKCHSLFRDIGDKAEKKAELPLRDKEFMKDRCISMRFVEHIYNILISEVSGKHSWYQGIELVIKEPKDKGNYYELFGINKSTMDEYFYAIGSNDEMEKCKSIFKELGKVLEFKTEAKKLIELTKNLEEYIEKIRDKLQKIIGMEKLPGRCQYT